MTLDRIVSAGLWLQGVNLVAGAFLFDLTAARGLFILAFAAASVYAAIQLWERNQ
ncbi:MAG: hypothetical protein ACREIB_01395 [Pseudomonadota bacterium]